MTQQHTPEPWWSGRDISHFHSLSSITGGGANMGGIRSVAEVTGPTTQEQEANTMRIVACVNAMQGIPNPAAFRAQAEADAKELATLRGLYAAAEEEIRAWRQYQVDACEYACDEPLEPVAAHDKARADAGRGNL